MTQTNRKQRMNVFFQTFVSVPIASSRAPESVNNDCLIEFRSTPLSSDLPRIDSSKTPTRTSVVESDLNHKGRRVEVIRALTWLVGSWNDADDVENGHFSKQVVGRELYFTEKKTSILS